VARKAAVEAGESDADGSDSEDEETKEASAEASAAQLKAGGSLRTITRPTLNLLLLLCEGYKEQALDQR